MDYSYKEILFGNKNELSTDTCYNMDESWKHYAKLKKPVNKRPHIVWLHLHEIFRTGKFIESESRIEVTMGWVAGRNRDLLFNGYRVSVWGDGKVLEIVVMIEHCDCN